MDPLPSMNKVYSLGVQEESNNAYFPLLTSVDHSNILVHAFELRKLQGCGKGFSCNITI